MSPLAGKPVRVQLMRWDETGWDQLAPAQVTDITAGLDANNNIIGGSWESWDRPDFTWDIIPNDFSGYFVQLKKIYLASIGQTTATVRPDVFPKPIVKPADFKFTVASKTFNYRVLPNEKTAVQRSWHIAPTGPVANITLTFTAIHLPDRQRSDRLKVYEGSPQNKGALVAVLYGVKDKVQVVVNAAEAFVVLSTESPLAGKGFNAVYSVN